MYISKLSKDIEYMKILHLCFDGNFIEQSMSVFDHFYPKNCFWIVLELKGKNRVIKREGPHIIRALFEEPDSYLHTVSLLNRTEKFDKIVCHGFNKRYTEAIKLLKPDSNLKVYWLFWGYELYRPLGKSGKKTLIDNGGFLNPLSYIMPTKACEFLWAKILGHESEEAVLKDFLNYADFFCFWFEEDYQLLQKYYHSKAEFRFFQYNAHWKNDSVVQIASERFFNKEPRTIIINHQASTTGNHITLLKMLKSLSGIDNFEITAPLSYGANTIRRYVSWKGKRLFGSKFHPVVNYMPLDSYNAMIGRMEVALFGQLRQEAAGNISFYLANGTKVFMREDNTLFQYFKNAGYIIFSLEKDLNTIKDLSGLSIEDKRHNAELSAKRVSYYEDFMPTLLD